MFRRNRLNEAAKRLKVRVDELKVLEKTQRAEHGKFSSRAEPARRRDGAPRITGGTVYFDGGIHLIA
jgi:hypothetical protein